MASLAVFFLKIVFAKLTGRTVHQIWTNEDSKHVVLRKVKCLLGF